ncbi:DUF6415 family natural product biosynthesis protein [Streptomyces johnsoniae]|uniref:DUF6415 family natural product biosynthesis protein n=1 Tax=Streptomyces johnsoniae TaxID=3075532 RepID=A0ABU2S0A9_9ACTN|nr:DUF6415 family natural product biosynthesis protein [Streptomyces sp. DSM 41886]MDT0441194.1 DUF6415 family natural product biosynthesis protein [Streptomyces sp. DSM 41886]
MNSTGKDASIDHDALRESVSRARSLYSAKWQAAKVAEVTEQLRGHLGVLVRECSGMAKRMPPHTSTRRRLEAALETAAHLLEKQPSGGPMSMLVHMQLLADSASSLATHVRTPS